MKSGLYVIFDKVAQEAGPVFSAKNDGIALRCGRALLKEASVDSLSDYKVVCVGTFEGESCVLVPESPAREVYQMTDIEEVIK